MHTLPLIMGALAKETAAMDRMSATFLAATAIGFAVLLGALGIMLGPKIF